MQLVGILLFHSAMIVMSGLQISKSLNDINLVLRDSPIDGLYFQAGFDLGALRGLVPLMPLLLVLETTHESSLLHCLGPRVAVTRATGVPSEPHISDFSDPCATLPSPSPNGRAVFPRIELTC